MFDRFLIYSRARKALQAGQFETALRLGQDPSIAPERRAAQLREKALKGMLNRARSRVKAGLWTAARQDVEAILAAEAEYPGAAALRDELAQALFRAEGVSRDAASLRDKARAAAERGDLKAATEACEAAASLEPEHADQAAVERFVQGRRGVVDEDLQVVRRALRDGDLDRLRPALARLRALAHPPAEVEKIAGQAVQLYARDFVTRLGAAATAVELRSVLDGIAAERGVVAVTDDARLQAALRKPAAEIHRAVRGHLASGEFEQAVATLRSVHPLLLECDPLDGVTAGIDALETGLRATEAGDLGAASEAMKRAAAGLQCGSCKKSARDLEATENRATELVREARDLAAAGQLLAAREQLLDMLKDWPMHEPLRRQMDILDSQSRDRAERLRQAQEAASTGELARASALLLGLSGDGEEGREARLLLREIQSRMDLAAEGLAQVRRAVHGPASSREGLRQLVGRLDEIAKMQTDLSELQVMRDALRAEIRGLDILEALSTAFDSGDLGKAQSEIAEFETLRGAMLREDRLDARFLEVTDRILQRADADVHGGRLTGAAAWLDVVRQVGDASQRSRIHGLQESVETRQARAEVLLDELESVVDDPARSADLLDEAREVWVDSPRLQKIESRLRNQAIHAAHADEVERLTGAGDVAGAQARLGALPPTPAFLRTRIYDIKQGLARAQGLDGGFLLRVDEGGEYLVLREDSFTIGNVRDAKADVRVLANVSGVHARFKRSLSFHGGMEDRIVAERGEVFVNGAKVDEALLRSGDVVRLGTAFEFVYRLPGKRSLTAALFLKSGFQVGGTDKILLMKDRGRDGRILVGRADDAHIRVPHDSAEVELFGATDGQIHARFSGRGDMGGKPFSGTHPVTAGSLVRCGDTAFVLQPWNQG